MIRANVAGLLPGFGGLWRGPHSRVGDGDV